MYPLNLVVVIDTEKPNRKKSIGVGAVFSVHRTHRTESSVRCRSLVCCEYSVDYCTVEEH